MALQMTLEAKYNHMATDFIDAYWKVTAITYDTEYAFFYLKAYPNRNASKKEGEFIEDGLVIGGSEYTNYRPVLYQWEGMATIQSIFPSGIPLDSNEQKTVIYNWIKQHVNLPFEDVFED